MENSRKRNVRIKILRAFINDNEVNNKVFKRDDFKDTFGLKEKDLKDYSSVFFEDLKNGSFKLKDINDDTIMRECIEKHSQYKNDSEGLKLEFEEIYKVLKDCFKGFKLDSETYKKESPRAIEIAKKLHYIVLPIYSETMIENRGITPEENMDEYYNHFHSLEDLYYEITGKGIDYKDIGGDCNLNKEISIKIYSSRWGHEDNYIIKRTINGWHLSMLAYTGDFNKDGYGKFFDSLKHDGIFFPKEAISYALELLWDEADSSPMSIKILKDKLTEIAEWINNVEKVAHNYQPDWCNYF